MPITLPAVRSAVSVSVVDHGAVGDAIRYVPGVSVYGAGSIATGTAVLTTYIGAAKFAAGDVGKNVTVAGAGAGGANLSTTILSFQSATQVTLAVNAGTSVTGARFVVGSAASFGAFVTAGSTTMTVPAATPLFTAADVGKSIVVQMAGALLQPLVTTIAAVGSSTSITLGTAALSSASGVEFTYGKDNTAAIQAAIDAVDALAQGGGQVLVPPTNGGYLCTGVLNVKERVSLVGAHEGGIPSGGYNRLPAAATGGQGSLLITTANAGSTTSTSAFITLRHGAVLRGLIVYHAGQTPSMLNPTAYPPCVTFYDIVTGNPHNSAAIRDCLFVNPYLGVWCDGHDRPIIENLGMHAINTGVYMNRVFDVPRLINVHCWQYWKEWSALDGTEQYMLANARAFDFRRVDEVLAVNLFAYGYAKGCYLGSTAAGVGYGSFANCDFDATITPVHFNDASQYGYKFTGCTFLPQWNNSARAILMDGGTGPGTLHVTDSVFQSSVADYLVEITSGMGQASMLELNHCEFRGWGPDATDAALRIASATARMRVADCTFNQTTGYQLDTAALTAANTNQVMLSDNLMIGGRRYLENASPLRLHEMGTADDATPDEVEARSLEVRGQLKVNTYQDLVGIAAPGAPAAGTKRLYVDTADSKIKIQNSSGVVQNLEEQQAASALTVIGFANPSATAVTTAIVAGTTYLYYIGKAQSALTTCDVVLRVTTAHGAVAGAEFSEVGICTGAFSANAATAMTRRGFTNTAAVLNATGIKKITVALSGIGPGDDLWLAVCVSEATQPIFRGTTADDLQSGAVQTIATRLSLIAAAAASTLGAATNVPPWAFVKV